MIDINEVRDRLSLHLFFTEEGSTAEVMEEDLRALLSDHARLQAMSVKCKRFLEDMHCIPRDQTIAESQTLHAELSTAIGKAVQP